MGEIGFGRGTESGFLKMSVPLIDSRFYGRRKGRPMRVQRQHDFNELLPKFSFELPAGAFNPAVLFPFPVQGVWLEIGFGFGEHLAEMAKSFPQIGMIGCEVFENGVGNLLSTIGEKQLQNIRIFPKPAQSLLKILPEQSIDRVFLLFADPWPKKRHARRRFVNPENLALLAKILKDGGEFRLASDDHGLITWISEHMLKNQDFRWLAETADDWLKRPEGWPATRYEEKAIAKGIQPVYWRFERIARK